MQKLASTESRQDIICLARLTRKPGLQRRERLWTPRHNWAIIGTWKNAVHSAELQ